MKGWLLYIITGRMYSFVWFINELLTKKKILINISRKSEIFHGAGYKVQALSTFVPIFWNKRPLYFKAWKGQLALLCLIRAHQSQAYSHPCYQKIFEMFTSRI